MVTVDFSTQSRTSVLLQSLAKIAMQSQVGVALVGNAAHIIAVHLDLLLDSTQYNCFLKNFWMSDTYPVHLVGFYWTFILCKVIPIRNAHEKHP